MSNDVIHIKSISELHKSLGFAQPKNPLISIIDTQKVRIPQEVIDQKIAYDFYMISLKDKSCGVDYGRNSFDFEEGVMVFSAPVQVYTPTRMVEEGEIEGWMLFFHPDLIRNTHLGGLMDDYSFFNYDVYEALHLSHEEELKMNALVQDITDEIEQRIDDHSTRVIVSNIELLLNYSLRFYSRQFNTRSNSFKGVPAQFEKLLKSYFSEEKQLEDGVPSIDYFAQQAHLSTHYFSDLIKKETGRSPKDHINSFLVEKAKSLLAGSNQSISEISYYLGFNYPHYFTRLFKNKTGMTPNQYRTDN